MGTCASNHEVEAFYAKQNELRKMGGADCDGFWNEEKLHPLENDVGDFMLSHDVIRELLRRCEETISEERPEKFPANWENLISFQEIQRVLYAGHISGETKKHKGLFEVLLKDDTKAIKALKSSRDKILDLEHAVSLTLVQEGWGDGLQRSFREYSKMNEKQLNHEEGILIPEMLMARQWRREFQKNVLPPALKLDFGWFIGFGVQILDDLTHNNLESVEYNKVAQWIQVFYKLATRGQWQTWHHHIHGSLLNQHASNHQPRSEASEFASEHTIE